MAKERKKQGKVGQDKSEIVGAIPMACADEDAAYEFMEKQRWEDSPCCPNCGDTDVYKMTGRDGKREKNRRWRCRGCGKLYSVRTGTVMEESRIPVRHWCFAFWAACSSKKGVSALQIKRQTGLSYKSALFMMHRIRWAMAPTGKGPKLTGKVQVDETFVGGKPRNSIPFRTSLRKPKNYPRQKPKQPVIAALCPESGQVRARVIPDVTSATLKAAVNELVDKSATLHTDERMQYRTIGREYAGHEAIRHKNKQYVRADGMTTNTVESFFALLKRGIIGTFHNVSRKHLQRYCDEFEFRYNHRKVDDGARTLAAIQGAVGKRLRYREPASDFAH